MKVESKSPTPNYRIRRLLAIVFILFVGLRGANVGVDTAVYYRHYYYFGEWGCDFVELGFDWINRFCYHQGLGAWSLFLICSILTIVPVYLMLNKLERTEYTITALLFYGTTMVALSNGMRQAVVCGIFLYLMSYFYNTTNLKVKDVAIYLCGILISSLMHATAFFLLPLFLLVKLKIDKIIYVFLYLLSFLFIFIDISPYMPDISLGVRDYGHHAAGEVLVRQASLLGFFVSTTLKCLTVFLMYKLDAFSKHRLLSHLTMIAFILSNMGFNIPIIGRITMYFSWFNYVMLSKMYSDYKQTIESQYYVPSYFKVVWLAVTLIFSVITFHSLTSPANEMQPYNFYWENKDYDNVIIDRL